MEKQLFESKKIQLVLERNRQQELHLHILETKTKSSSNNFFEIFLENIDGIHNWFDKFKISELELIISTISILDFTKLFKGKNHDQELRGVLEQNENTFENKDVKSVSDKVYGRQNPLNNREK